MTTQLDSGPTHATDALRLLVDEVLLSVSADGAGRHAGSTPTGRALLSLAALVRRAAALAAESGGPFADAPGTVVQREFAAAARLLSEAADAAHGDSWEVADLLVRAEGLQARPTATGG